MMRAKIKPPMFINEILVGDVVDHALRIQADTSEWVRRDPHGWSLDIRILKIADQRNIKSIALIDMEEGCFYQAPLSDFWKVGIRADQERYRRICLPMKFWEVTRMLI